LVLVLYSRVGNVNAEFQVQYIEEAGKRVSACTYKLITFMNLNVLISLREQVLRTCHNPWVLVAVNRNRHRLESLTGARFILLALTLLPLADCRTPNPQQGFAHARQTFIHGDLLASQEEAEHGYEEFVKSHPEWALKFRVLKAEILVVRGMSSQALELLAEVPASSDQSSAISVFTLRAVSYARLHQFSDSERELQDAERLCAAISSEACGEVLRGRGVLSTEEGRYQEARNYFNETLAFARVRGDHFLEATAFLSLSAASLHQNHLDDAIERAEAARRLSIPLEANELSQIAVGNLGWAYYKLGDSEKALESFLAAKAIAERAGDVLRQAIWLTDIASIYLDRSDYPDAEQSFKRALNLAREIDAKEYIRNALIPLALVYAREGKFNLANSSADEAIKAAREDKNRLDELYPLLVKGQVAAQLHDNVKAEAIFREVANDAESDASLKWEAQHSLARLEENQAQRVAAASNYQAALCTFETARSSVHGEESKLPFFTNAARIYDDYISFLITSGQARRALEVADFSRGRTLAEGLGYLKNDRPCSTPPLTPERVAANANATILYYSLGQHQSYLWAITRDRIRNFVLPPAGEIESSIRRYREVLMNGEDVLGSSSKDGLQLYQTLIAPAAANLPKNVRVVVVPDGSLTALNFETLLAPGKPGPHYWIEDAVISNAQSLRLLLAEKGTAASGAGKMLLVGDAVPHPPEFPALVNARLEIQNIEKHFSTAELTTYTQSSATAASFLSGKPEQYSYIHFVAHAVASSQVPLDSAVILSPRPDNGSFKLYAREIIEHRLRARLVTVSACYGAGTRAYNGEGLIGLSWAFLRAGAKNTIGALWEVNDASTPHLMDTFYAELKEGRPPEISLRDAKLSLMRSNKVFSKPFYWAPFQLYGTS